MGVLPMCKEARYDFFIGNCCLTSEFCPTSCERGEAQRGWVVFTKSHDWSRGSDWSSLTLAPLVLIALGRP